MSTITLHLQDPRWHAHETPVAVHWTSEEEGGTQHLVVEAPNWAHWWAWSQQAAVTAFGMLRQLGHAPGNPADGHLKVWAVVPGFPKVSPGLWQEPFSRYDSRPRNVSHVQELLPIAGSERAKLGSVLAIGEALELWDGKVQLKHPRTYGLAG